MLYDIRLSIRHDYGVPSPNARTQVRLLPTDLPGRQIVRSRLLRVTPRPSERDDVLDFFGNVMTTLAFHRPIASVELGLRARVEVLEPPDSLDLSPDLKGLSAEAAAVRLLSAESPAHFIGASPRVAPDTEISAFAHALAAPGMTTTQIAEALSQALHDEMQFDPGATDVHTPPSVAFAARHGVCQDFSHIMIAGLRALGIPAGYVSGFLRTLPPPGKPRLAGADAMHAWVRVWCGSEVGWVEYDPTNACRAGTDHIAVAYGRDYGDVAPVKGVLRTAGPQVSEHSVDVEPLEASG
ncbi:MAG: transglutaminase family protein [Pseudomonadota bacterium]